MAPGRCLSSDWHGGPVPIRSALRRHWKLTLYAVVLMTVFNFFSHGTQDIYPTFLEQQHHFRHATVGFITVIYNIGAILGGLTLGCVSQTLGRRRTMMVAALLAIPAVWLWAYSAAPAEFALGAFLLQFFVQGAWGVIPAHLNELSPRELRGTFPGTVYQLGNFIASSNAIIQTWFAERHGGNYALALATVAVLSAIALLGLAFVGRDAKNAELAAG
jgi:SHS family lactate transporter-like MFS transporter